MLEPEEAILRVANKLCKINITEPCSQPCAKHSAEARVAVYTLLDAVADIDEVPTALGFDTSEARVHPRVMSDIARGRRKYVLRSVDRVASYGEAWKEEVLEEVTDWATADMLSSETVFSSKKGKKALHRPVFDIDFEAQLIPSTTEDHFHLYFQKAVRWRAYKRVLKAMYKAGLIERGWYKLSVKRGMATMWLPKRKNALKAVAKRDSYGAVTQKVRYLS